MRDQLIHRWRLLRWALIEIPLAALSLAAFVFTITDVALIAVWVGIPMLAKDIAVTRWLADLHRRYAGGFRGVVVDRPYLHTPAGNPLTRTRAVLADPATRRDLRWLFVNGSLGLALAVVGVVEGVLGLLFWWIPPGIAMNLHAKIDVALLQPAEKSRLALRVEQLTESRAETVDTQAAELRRIERDLHDGAQARLVAIGMSLGLAEEQLDRDPELAKSLLLEARDTAGDALAELRDLVRGIHPPVLAERGFEEAVRALISAIPISIEVRSSIQGRLPAPVESAAYFAVAEVLSNAVKHASATHIKIDLGQTADVVELRIEDDGVGGADPLGGMGLRGVARRLAAFDGALAVESPRGGPTKVVMVLPCASSSAKISPSSGTA
jgi:signal transduction histidine kinase